VSGVGVIDAFTVARHFWIPGYETPYIVARVRLAEQDDVILVTNIVGANAEQIAIGAGVEVVFEQRRDTYVPMFRLTQ
jgi:uncharacterized OB-fold protein